MNVFAAERAGALINHGAFAFIGLLALIIPSLSTWFHRRNLGIERRAFSLALL
jgi:hypothetical protein